MESGQKAVYLFCFARTDLVGELQGSGVDGQHPLSISRRFPDVCAVLSEVAVEDFCGPAAELRLEQLAWVGPRAIQHEAVVEEVMGHSPVLPVRFGTLFSSPESLAEFLDKHHKTISEFLDRVTNHQEWSVKGLLDRKEAEQAAMTASLAVQEAQLAVLPPGIRYFQEKRVRAGAEKDLNLWLNEICRQVADDLLKQASDFRECPVVPREPQEAGIEVVLNWAFLLPRSSTPAFHAQVDQLNARLAPKGLVFEPSGPWPPYRFVPPLSRAEDQ
jgi:hypothetical protein